MKRARNWIAPIALALLAGCDSPELVRLDAGQLHYRDAARDDPGLGPNAFDIDSHGGIVVSDPVAERIVYFTPRGRFRGAVPLGFASDRLQLLENGTVLVRRAANGLYYLARQGAAPTPAAPPTARPPAQAPAVRFESKTERLVGVQWAAEDERGARFGVLEIATGSHPIQLRRLVRKYNRGGRLILEQSLVDAPVIDSGQDLRIRNNQVLQLLVNGHQTQVARWSMPPL